jgi:hypothetical protein
VKGGVRSKKLNRYFRVSWKGGVCGNGGSKRRGRRNHAPKVAKGLNAFLRRAAQRFRRAREKQWRKDWGDEQYWTWEEDSRDAYWDDPFWDEQPEEYPDAIHPSRMWGFGMLVGWEEPKLKKGSWLDKQLGPETYCQLHGHNAGCDCDTDSYYLGWDDEDEVSDDYYLSDYSDEDWYRSIPYSALEDTRTGLREKHGFECACFYGETECRNYFSEEQDRRETEDWYVEQEEEDAERVEEERAERYEKRCVSARELGMHYQGVAATLRQERSERLERIKARRGRIRSINWKKGGLKKTS